MKCLGQNLVFMEGDKATERQGILLPEGAQKASNRGEVIAVGPDVQNIEVGDYVLIPPHVFMRAMQTRVCDIMIQNKPAFVVREEDVAVIWPQGEGMDECGEVVLGLDVPDLTHPSLN